MNVDLYAPVELITLFSEGMKKRGYGKIVNTASIAGQIGHPDIWYGIAKAGIINATKLLKPGGKIIVITFHSIEDKIIKFFFNNFSTNRSKPSRYFPENKKNNTTLFDNYKNKIIKPSKFEVEKNPPSRSAKLRYATRNKNEFIYPNELIDKFKSYLDLERSNA